MKLRKNIFTMLLVLIIITVLMLSGCKSKNTEITKDSAPAEDIINESSGSRDIIAEEEGISTDNQELKDKVLDQRKIIQRKNYIMETLEFDNSMKLLEELTLSLSGYIESSSISGKEINDSATSDLRRAYFVFRIPSEKLSIFQEKAKKIGNIITEETNKEDVSAQLVDIEARLVSLKTQEKRLLELTEKSGSLKDILEIETKLSDVRYQIESFMASKTNIENQVQYSTVSLQLKEVIKQTEMQKPAITMGERIIKGFSNSLSNVGAFIVNFVVVFISAIPYLVMILAFSVLGIIIWKEARKKIKPKK